jgi:hypothetical protein
VRGCAGLLSRCLVHFRSTFFGPKYSGEVMIGADTILPWVVMLTFSAVLSLQTADTSAQRGGLDNFDANVSFVSSGGSWTSGQQTGSYRAIVVTRGYEHLTSRMYVQWLSDGTRESPTRVVRTVLASDVPVDLWTFSEPKFVLMTGRWQLLVDGVNQFVSPQTRQTWRLALGEPGDVKLVPRGGR